MLRGVVDLVDPFQRALTTQFTAQDVRHRAAALSTTPAENQRQPVLFPVAESVTQMVGDVFGDVGRADLLGGKRRNLLVQGADLDPLLERNGWMLVIRDWWFTDEPFGRAE